MYNELNELENQLEVQEKQVEDFNQKEEQLETREQQLQESILKLEKDCQVIAQLNKNVEKVESEKENLSDQKRKYAEHLEEIEEQLQELVEEINNSESVLEDMENRGEDVTDAKEIVQNRREYIIACQEKVKEMAEILSLNIGEINLETFQTGTMSGKTESEVEAKGEEIKEREKKYKTIKKNYQIDKIQKEQRHQFLIRQKEIGLDKTLSISQKVEYIKKEYNKLTNKRDLHVSSSPKYVSGFDKRGVIVYKWPPRLGFRENTIESISRTNPMPEKWDRYGGMKGENFSPIPESGSYSYEERAIPYIMNPGAYHKGTINTESYFDKIDAIRRGDAVALNNILRKEGIAPVGTLKFTDLQDIYYDFIKDTRKNLGRQIDATYGVKGIAAAFDDLCGGAEQFIPPFNGIILKRLGIMVEENQYE